MPKDQNPPDDTTTPNYVTADELDAKINAALTNHASRQSKTFGKLLDEKLSALIAQKPEGGEAPDNNKGESEVAAQLKALQAKLDAQIKRAEEAERAREATEAKRLADEQRGALGTALRDAGVNPALAKAAQAVLEAEGRIGRDENGAIVFKAVDKYGNEKVAPLAEGIGEWAKTAEGKIYLPPRPAAGSGAAAGKPAVSRNVPMSGHSTGPKTAEQTAADARAKLREMFAGGAPSGD